MSPTSSNPSPPRRRAAARTSTALQTGDSVPLDGQTSIDMPGDPIDTRQAEDFDAAATPDDQAEEQAKDDALVATKQRVLDRAQAAYDKTVVRLRANYAALQKAQLARDALNPQPLADDAVQAIATGTVTEVATAPGIRKLVAAGVRCTRHGACAAAEPHLLDAHLDPASPIYDADLVERLTQIEQGNAVAASEPTWPAETLLAVEADPFAALQQHVAEANRAIADLSPAAATSVELHDARVAADTAAYEASAAVAAARAAGAAKPYTVDGLPAAGAARVAEAMRLAAATAQGEPQANYPIPAADPLPVVPDAAAVGFDPFAPAPAASAPAFDPFAP